jgi:hypothetical protein
MLKLVQVDPPVILTTFMMAKDSYIDDSLHKSFPLNQEEDLLQRYILAINPFKILLVDTKTNEVLTLGRVGIS